MKAVAERYLARQESRLRPSSFKSAKLYLLKHLKSLHGLRLDKITRADVASRLSSIAEKSGAVTADRVRSNLSSLYAWAIGEGLCETNPTIGVTKHAADIKARDRVLSDKEIVAIWNALPKRGQHYGSVIKLLMLTGCRADEIGWLRWSEVDMERKMISLPEDRVKNGNPVDIPLSDLAVEILANTPRRDDRDLVFGVREGGFQGWSKSKDELDARLPASMEPWRVHDIRRSVATGMAELGVLPHVIEAVLNHLSGHKKGVAGIYNRATYGKEKAAALDLWANHISVLLAQAEGANVHRLQRA
jgi:integrase